MSEENCETNGKKETESGYILETEPTGGRREIPFTEMGVGGVGNRIKIGLENKILVDIENPKETSKGCLVLLD